MMRVCTSYSSCIAFQKEKKGVDERLERSCWDYIDSQFMTEKSEGEDAKIVRHLLPWRSEGKLCSLYIHNICLHCTFYSFE